ncbi:MFS general substrate transporter [Daldinia caldariorum]|uniref:MFS general substrate transporter n=1 Tax=Daldinia caldariorum TaxID=326644 RepID=UPI002008435E|nr:MFS general substrate transporter [Daldinia caldariorum]KAI1464492.1 MFS general substrate transporter [Daldinia caldariorum]
MVSTQIKETNHAVAVVSLGNSQVSLGHPDESVTPKPNIEDEVEYPDGGSAWLQVLACHLINAMACGYGAAFGIYQLYYTETLKLPASQISWIGSIQIFINNLVCTVAGRLADAGYARETVLGGSFIALLGTFMSSLATQYWQIFLSQGVCTGLGLGLMYMPTVTVVTSYFKKRRALALALSTAGTGTGSIIFPATVQYLIPQIGFAWAVRCAGFVALTIVIIVNVLLKPRQLPKKTGPMVDWLAFKEPPYVIFVAGTFFVYWALYFGYFYINTYAITVASFTPTSAVSLLLIMNAVGVPTRPVIGYIADTYLGPINAFILSTLSLAVAFFAWITINTPSTMYGFAIVFGVTNSAAQAAFASGLASLTSNPVKMGTRFGMCCTILALATVAGPPTAGAIIDYCGGQYLWAQVWAGLVSVLGAATLSVARYKVSGAKLMVMV